MSFEKSEALANERANLRDIVKSQLSQIDALKKELGVHARSPALAEEVDIGEDDSVFQAELAAGRKALQNVQRAIEVHQRAEAALDKARQEEAKRKRTMKIVIGVGVAIVAIALFALAGG